MKKLIIIFLFFFVSVAYGEDKTIWLEPGVSAGPVRLGDDRKNVLKELGLPDDITNAYGGYVDTAGRPKGFPLMYDISYDNGLFIEMNPHDDMRRIEENFRKGIKQNEKKELEATVLRVTSYSPHSKTRGNIGIGSTLPEVLNVFGDNQMKTIRREPLKTVVCSIALIFKYPENKRSSLKEENYNGYMLSVDYFQEGIDFIFKLDDGMPKVFAITVSEKKECKIKFDMERNYVDIY